MEKEKIFKMNGGKKFDIILSNPPYDSKLHHRFLLKYLDIANVICSVQPANWLLSKQKNKKIIDKLNTCDTNIELINGNKYFDAGISGNISINLIKTNEDLNIVINNESYNNYDDINTYSIDKYIKIFYDKTQPIKVSAWDKLKDTDKWLNKQELKPNKNWWCIKISKIRGHVNKSNNNKESKDFYTIISNDNNFIYNKGNYGLYKNIVNIPNQKGKTEFLYFAFDTKQELDNFISYIKTDFVRTCLKLTKTNVNMHRGELKTIPWFDFSDEHFSKSPREIDDWLFDKYGISKEIRKHIKNILPDYYGIRK